MSKDSLTTSEMHFPKQLHQGEIGGDAYAVVELIQPVGILSGSHVGYLPVEGLAAVRENQSPAACDKGPRASFFWKTRG